MILCFAPILGLENDTRLSFGMTTSPGAFGEDILVDAGLNLVGSNYPHQTTEVPDETRL